MQKTWKAWVLSGAGARGAFEAGVIQELEWGGERPDFICGTSAGALNSVGFAYSNAATVANIWREKIRRREDVFGTKYNPLSIVKTGLFDSKPLAAIIESVVGGHPTVPCACCVCDLSDMRPVYYNSNDTDNETMRKMVRASASIPGVVEPVDETLVDGGVVCNAPLRYAVDQCPIEGGEVTVITGQNLYRPFDINFKPKSVVDILMRSLDAICLEQMRDDVLTCQAVTASGLKKPITVRLIQPPREFIMGGLDFSPESIFAAFTLGIKWRDFNPTSNVTP